MNPKVLLLDEPTRGVDIGAKQEIYRLMEELAERGVAILFVSSEMEEVLSMSDRAIVMHEGRITGELARDQLSEEAVMQLATGNPLASNTGLTLPMKKILGIFGLLLFICVATALMSDRFLTEFNIENLIRRSALFGILSIGAAFVIITAGIDLSIGSVVCLIGCLMPWMLVDHELPVPLVLLIDYLDIAADWSDARAVDHENQAAAVCGHALRFALLSRTHAWNRPGSNARIQKRIQRTPGTLARPARFAGQRFWHPQSLPDSDGRHHPGDRLSELHGLRSIHARAGTKRDRRSIQRHQYRSHDHSRLRHLRHAQRTRWTAVRAGCWQRPTG